MKSIAFLFLLFLLALDFSCKKDDLQIAYPSAYHKSGLKVTGDLRVFSSNGEIKNPSIISRFAGKDTAYYSAVANYIINERGVMDSIKFSDAQHGIMNDRYQPLKCLISRQDDTFVLSRTDTTRGYSSGDEFTHSMMYYIGNIKPEVYTEYLISSVRGLYVFGYTAREKFVLKESHGQLVAPLIQFIQHRNDVQLNIGYVNNILLNDFYKMISTDDTVTIMEYQILYEK